MENKTGMYLKYAIGEIVLVVIGILIALQINNWNENRKAKKVEQTLLTELQKTIREDIKNLSDVIALNKSHISSAEIVLNSIQDQPIISDSISYHLSRSFEVVKLDIKVSAYGNLKDYGLHLIQNDDTRKSIISGYDGMAKFVDLVYERYDQFLYNVVEPKLAEGFKLKKLKENDYRLFPLNNSPNSNRHTIKYLLQRSILLQDKIVKALYGTKKLFQTIDEDLKIEILNH
jgi:hypothetical protein